MATRNCNQRDLYALASFPHGRAALSTECERENLSGNSKVMATAYTYDIRRSAPARKARKRLKTEDGLQQIIRKRDKTVHKRQVFGHQEAGTVLSGQGKSKACFLLLRRRERQVAYRHQDPGPERPKRSASDHLRKIKTADRSGEGNYPRPEKPVRLLA